MSKKWYYGIIEILPVNKKYDPVLDRVWRDFTNHPYCKEDSSVICAISVKLPCALAIQKFRDHLLKHDKKLQATDFELVLTKHFPLPEAVANKSDILYISTKCLRWRYGCLKDLRKTLSLIDFQSKCFASEAQRYTKTFPL